MLRPPTIDVRATRKVFDAAARRGVAPEALCHAAGVDLSLVNASDERVPFGSLVALYERAAALTHDDAFGLHLAEESDAETYDLLGYLVLNSETFGDALRNLMRYVGIWTDAVSFSLETMKAEARLTYVYRSPAPAPEQRRQEAEHMLGTMIRAARLMTGTGCKPLRVHFEHRKPKTISEHKRVFGAPLRFQSARTELVFNPRDLERPVLKADERLRALLERHANGLLAALPRTGTWADEVRRAISEASRPDDLRLEAVARRLKTGTRTLQRQLAAEGSSFQAVVRETRSLLAKNYLRDPKLAICEVAYLLGFSQPSAFHRAFQEWEGMTPRAFRTSAPPRQDRAAAP
jgi:AraC-like DNA-binding protein